MKLSLTKRKIGAEHEIWDRNMCCVTGQLNLILAEGSFSSLGSNMPATQCKGPSFIPVLSSRRRLRKIYQMNVLGWTDSMSLFYQIYFTMVIYIYRFFSFYYLKIGFRYCLHVIWIISIAIFVPWKGNFIKAKFPCFEVKRKKLQNLGQKMNFFGPIFKILEPAAGAIFCPKFCIALGGGEWGVVQHRRIMADVLIFFHSCYAFPNQYTRQSASKSNEIVPKSKMRWKLSIEVSIRGNTIGRGEIHLWKWALILKMYFASDQWSSLKYMYHILWFLYILNIHAIYLYPKILWRQKLKGLKMF